MPLRRLAAATLLLFALAGTSACATSQAVASGEMLNVQLQVNNNLPGITGVSVYLVSDGGSRRSLGPLESNRQGVYDREIRAGTYHLLATRVGAQAIESERFRVDTDNLVIIWALGQNQLTFGQR